MLHRNGIGVESEHIRVILEANLGRCVEHPAQVSVGYTSFDIVDREEDAIRAAEKRCPDLITTDQRIAGGSGVGAVRVICATRAIPVVFISEYRAEVLRLAPDAVIVGKPFGEQSLRDAVEQAILVVSLSADEAD